MVLEKLIIMLALLTLTDNGISKTDSKNHKQMKLNPKLLFVFNSKVSVHTWKLSPPSEKAWSSTESIGDIPQIHWIIILFQVSLISFVSKVASQ